MHEQRSIDNSKYDSTSLRLPDGDKPEMFIHDSTSLPETALKGKALRRVERQLSEWIEQHLQYFEHYKFILNVISIYIKLNNFSK